MNNLVDEGSSKYIEMDESNSLDNWISSRNHLNIQSSFKLGTSTFNDDLKVKTNMEKSLTFQGNSEEDLVELKKMRKKLPIF